jgi:hypothetical protein
MTGDDPRVPHSLLLRSSTLALADDLASRLSVDREVVALEVPVDRDTVLRLAIERGLAAMAHGLTLRVLRQENAEVVDPVAWITGRRG